MPQWFSVGCDIKLAVELAAVRKQRKRKERDCVKIKTERNKRRKC